MSLRSKTHGYTAWVNMRLLPYNQSLNNVLMDLLQGTNMKYLIESMTGHDWNKLDTFEKLTKEQIQTRITWILDELKRYDVVSKDLKIDTRMFAIRSSKHVFELLWRLITHDIWFLWERIEFLTNLDDDVLLKAPFSWIPNAPEDKPKKEHKKNISLLSGFAAAPSVRDVVNDNLKKADTIYENFEKFPGFNIMKSYSTHDLTKRLPDPKRCIIEMVKLQLKVFLVNR